MANCGSTAFGRSGFRPSDSFYFAFSWGNFAGFWSAYWGARRLGCRVLSGGGLDTKGHIQAILRMRPTVLISTPTFALRMAAVAAEMGIDLSQSSIKYTYHAGEPGPTALPAMRAQLEQAWGAKAGELLGIAEVDAMAPGCPEGDGVHVNEMNVFSWSMDPESGAEAGEGEIGENIVTSYANTAQPLLNYRTHDLVLRRVELPVRAHLEQARGCRSRPHRLHAHRSRHERISECRREFGRRNAGGRQRL